MKAVIAAIVGLWALPVAAAELSPGEAARHVGETVTVCGLIASTKFDDQLPNQPTFLDFEKPYPDHVFTAVIFGDDRAKFGTPEKSLRGKRVCVTGEVKLYQENPEIMLSDPGQLKVE